jgi:hypothetical protein
VSEACVATIVFPSGRTERSPNAPPPRTGATGPPAAGTEKTTERPASSAVKYTVLASGEKANDSTWRSKVSVSVRWAPVFRSRTTSRQVSAS